MALVQIAKHRSPALALYRTGFKTKKAVALAVYREREIDWARQGRSRIFRHRAKVLILFLHSLRPDGMD